MSTATAVPVTHGELEGDEALETLRDFGRVRLLRDSFVRFRAADGFSHSRALAFQFTLTLLPALIALVGLAAALEQRSFAQVVRAALNDLAPGAIGDLLTQALRQGTASARQEHGEVALSAGGLTALASGATAMAQFERGANRIYGTERDRPLLRKYLVGLGLASSAGVAAVLALTVLVGGSAIRRAAGWEQGFDTAWAIGRWPLGIALAVLAVSLLFEVSPRRRQPEPSWLAFGAAVSVVLWLALVGALKLYVEVTGTFGATYGPVAGTIGVLLWAFASALALLLGLAFAAQLEAVRAGVDVPRVAREDNLPSEPGPDGPAPSPGR